MRQNDTRMIGPVRARNSNNSEEVAARKRPDCPDYNSCLDTAIKFRWTQWQCTACRKFERQFNKAEYGCFSRDIGNPFTVSHST